MQKNPSLKETLYSWYQVLVYGLRKVVQIDTTNITAVRAIQSSIGFSIPLVLGVATGHSIIGISLAGGALSLGGVGLAEPQYTRKKMMLMACLGIALSAFVGSISGPWPWLSIVITGLWGLGAGLLVCLGTSYLVLGLQSVCALIILSHFMLDPLYAAIQALLMFCGALFQVLLTLIPIPGTSISIERTALANTYRSLSKYAANPANDQCSIQIRDDLTTAQKILVRGNLNSRSGTVLAALFEQAERMRMDILIFRNWRKRVLATAGGYTSDIKHLDDFLRAAAEQLQAIADELLQSRSLVRGRKLQKRVKESLHILYKQTSILETQNVPQPLSMYSTFLRNHLHFSRKLAYSLHFGSRTPVQRHSIPATEFFPRDESWRTLKANLTFRSAVFRHAIRLGFSLALGTALYRLVPLPYGYWIALTMVLVLRPDFHTTFSRGIARSLGTIVGALLITAFVSFIKPTPMTLVLVNIIAGYIAYSLLFANYALFSLFFAVGVICLLSFVTSYPDDIALYRAVDTAIGGLFALLIYILWPTWERVQAPIDLADRIESVHLYCCAVLKRFMCVNQPDQLERYRTEARLARSNAEAVVERAQHEPRSQRIDIDLARGILGACDAIMGSALALEAYLQDNPDFICMPELTLLVDSLDEALQQLSSIVRNGDSGLVFPDLQKELHALRYRQNLAVAKSSQSEHRDEIKKEQRFLLSEVKHIIDTVEALHRLLAVRQF